MRLISLAAFAVATLISTTAAIADDWVAIKLRGVVLTLVDGDWVKLARGETVSDDRVIRTLRGGRVTFVRGAETIDLGGDTQVQIFDRAGKKFTTVKQYFGTVGVEADVRQVQHFAVQTPHIAAVVKGTKFVVSSGKDSARVEVKRGRVAVEDRDTRQSTIIGAGQSAGSSDGIPLQVSGRGTLPLVYEANGRPVAVADAGRSASGGDEKDTSGKKDTSEGNSSSGNGNSGNGNSGNGNSGNGNSGGGNSGGGNSGSGNSGNGNSGSGNSGNGNDGNGNNGKGNSGRND